MKAYKPNFEDPRVQYRAKQALGFALGVLSPLQPLQWSTRYIDKFFGVSSNNLSRYLRKTLLITTNDIYFFGADSKCKEYILNESGVNKIKALLNLTEITAEVENDSLLKTHNTIPYCITSPNSTDAKDYSLVVDSFEQHYSAELSSQSFEYKNQSNRYWHPLQNVKSLYRSGLLAKHGLTHQYDIECCAPTLILNLSRELGNDLWLSALQNYIKNRSAIRAFIAKDIGISTEVVKRIVNALLAGAYISHSPSTDIYKMVQGDHSTIELLKQHHYLTRLRADMRASWEYINESLPQRYVEIKSTKSSYSRRVPLNSKRKWAVYFQEERRVIDCLKQYLSENNNNCFLEHDGWTCARELDISHVQEYILQHTGIRLKLEKS
jgi:hypothetical protein